MDYKINEEHNFKYVETEGEGETLVLLHGLFGALSNFEDIIRKFSKRWKIVVPILPIFDLPIIELSVTGLVDYVHKFIEYKNFKKINVLGNSLGGHIALLYVLAYPDNVQSVILTGSSGLFENAMGSSFPKRKDYDFIRKKTQNIFYDPLVANKALVDQVFSIVNDRNKAIRVIATAKSAIRHNLGDKLHQIKVPTLIIWGKQDKVTPDFVGEKFHKLIENSTLIMVDQCGHAPMMEKPDIFNGALEDFLTQFSKRKAYS